MGKNSTKDHYIIKAYNISLINGVRGSYKLTVRCPGMIFETVLSLSCFSSLSEYHMSSDSS
jgi:hypothetical protein